MAALLGCLRDREARRSVRTLLPCSFALFGNRLLDLVGIEFLDESVVEPSPVYDLEKVLFRASAIKPEVVVFDIVHGG